MMPCQGHHYNPHDLLFPRVWISGVEVAKHHFGLTATRFRKQHEYKRYSQDLREYVYKDHAMAQVKALRLSNYCISISFLHYHLSELINLAQPQTLLVD